MITTWIIALPLTALSFIIGLLPGTEAMPAGIDAAISTIFGWMKAFDWLIPWTPIAIGIGIVTFWYGVEISVRIARFALSFAFKNVTPK